MHLLGCLFVLLFGGIIFVLAFAGLIIDNILIFLGLKKRRQPYGGFNAYWRQGNPQGPFGQQGQNDGFDSVDSSSSNAYDRGRQQHSNGNHGPQQGGKIFQKDDSEYVDFEEV